MKAEEFLQTWIAFAEDLGKENSIWKFQNHVDRTKSVLGMDDLSGNISPFGLYFENLHKDYHYQKLNNRLDLSFKKRLTLSELNNFDDSSFEKYTEAILEENPIFDEILLKHESDLTVIAPAMGRLASYPGNLKVLITYNYDERSGGACQAVFSSLPEFFKMTFERKRQSNITFDGVYLLIIGQWLKLNSVIWKHHIFRP